MRSLIILAALTVVPAFGQTGMGARAGKLAPAPQQVQKAWGTASDINYVIGAWEFQPYYSASAPLDGITGAERGGGTPGAVYEAHFHLPTGSAVVAIEISGCDNSAASQITATMFESPESGVPVNRGSVSTGLATTGCNYYTATVTPFFFDNYFNSYAVEVNLGSPIGNTFSAVRIYYFLQVSPGPATATFSDVPTSHIFFQYIEALAASGITTGCTAPPNPNFCPDAPLTRGQMAVFLSRALGLHWPH